MPPPPSPPQPCRSSKKNIATVEMPLPPPQVSPCLLPGPTAKPAQIATTVDAVAVPTSDAASRASPAKVSPRHAPCDEGGGVVLPRPCGAMVGETSVAVRHGEGGQTEAAVAAVAAAVASSSGADPSLAQGSSYSGVGVGPGASSAYYEEKYITTTAAVSGTICDYHPVGESIAVTVAEVLEGRGCPTTAAAAVGDLEEGQQPLDNALEKPSALKAGARNKRRFIFGVCVVCVLAVVSLAAAAMWNRRQ